MSDPTYREAQLAGRPAWFSGEIASLLLEVLGIVKDLFVGAVTEGVKLRTAPEDSPDALEAALDDRNLKAGVVETEDKLGEIADRTTLAGTWQLWKNAFTKAALQNALVRGGYPGAAVYDGHDTYGRTPHGWWDFWVVLRPPYPPNPWNRYTTSITFGRDTTYGSGAVYQDDILGVEKRRLIALIKRWSPANTVLVEVAIPVRGPRYGDGHRFGEPVKYGGRVIYWRF